MQKEQRTQKHAGKILCVKGGSHLTRAKEIEGKGHLALLLGRLRSVGQKLQLITEAIAVCRTGNVQDVLRTFATQNKAQPFHVWTQYKYLKARHVETDPSTRPRHFGTAELTAAHAADARRGLHDLLRSGGLSTLELSHAHQKGSLVGESLELSMKELDFHVSLI